MITLENYVLEQEINDAQFSDVVLEQAIAEYNVAKALYDAYSKQDAIVEYVGAENYEEAFVQEGEKWDSVKEGAKKLARGGATLLRKAWELLMRGIESVLNIWRKFDIEKTIARLEDVDANRKISIDLAAINNMHRAWNLTTNVADKLYVDDTDPKTYIGLLDTSHKIMTDEAESNADTGTKEEVTVGAFRAALVAMYKDNKDFGVGFNKIKKQVNLDRFLKDNPECPKQTIDAINKCLKTASDVYIAAAKNLQKGMNEVYKNEAEYQKQAKNRAKQKHDDAKAMIAADNEDVKKDLGITDDNPEGKH
jgi:hypothetical protein